MFTIFFFNDTATTEIYTLSLHDALPISFPSPVCAKVLKRKVRIVLECEEMEKPLLCPTHTLLSSSVNKHHISLSARSEEHTSELQSRQYLVCRLLLEKKKTTSPKSPSAN